MHTIDPDWVGGFQNLEVWGGLPMSNVGRNWFRNDFHNHDAVSRCQTQVPGDQILSENVTNLCTLWIKIGSADFKISKRGVP